MDKDLLVTRMMAHFNYLERRMYDKQKRSDFIKGVVAITSFNMNYFQNNNNEGSKMALDIWNEILEIHNERFVKGRSGDAYFEKI